MNAGDVRSGKSTHMPTLCWRANWPGDPKSILGMAKRAAAGVGRTALKRGAVRAAAAAVSSETCRYERVRVMKLENKVAIITGGARGIGAAMVDRYVAEGAKVAIADIALSDAQQTAARHGDEAFAVQIDVTKIASIEAAIDAVVARWSGVDILVNNAGVFDMGPIVEVSEASWDKVFSVNTKGLFFTLQAVAKRMIAQGRGGKIINFASQAGRRGEALVATYCASKAAVLSITQSAGLDLIRHRINVNGLAPGVVDTPMWGQVDAPVRQIRAAADRGEEAAGRRGSALWSHGPAAPISAGLPCFFASSDADYVVAQTLNVDGGNWMS